jgi:hypothetical protein
MIHKVIFNNLSGYFKLQGEPSMKHWIAAAVMTFAIATGAYAKEPVRLDGSSEQAAVATWEAMVDSAKPKTRKKLIEAVLKINLAGVKSAAEAAENPELQSLGIVRIKDQVAGMTAEEIIEYGERVSTVTIEEPVVQKKLQ